MTRSVLGIVLVCLPVPALAEVGITCRFTVECVAAGACEAVEIISEIGLLDHGATLFVSDSAEAVAARRLSAEDDPRAVFVALAADGNADMITIDADGTALRTMHSGIGATHAVTYFGSCEEM